MCGRECIGEQVYMYMHECVIANVWMGAFVCLCGRGHCLSCVCACGWVGVGLYVWVFSSVQITKKRRKDANEENMLIGVHIIHNHRNNYYRGLVLHYK